MGEDTGTQQQAESTEPQIPKHRFDEVSERMKAAEKQAKETQEQLEQIENERAQQAGEYKKLAEKAESKAATLEQELEQVKASYLKERRQNTFRQAASGIIRTDALDDAFQFLSSEEMDKLEDSDTEGFKALAQNLADNKPYLQDAARGAGSRGSQGPVLAASNGETGRKPLPFGGNKRRLN